MTQDHETMEGVCVPFHASGTENSSYSYCDCSNRLEIKCNLYDRISSTCMDRKLSSAIESLHRAIEQATKYPVACQQYTPVNNEATDSLQKNTCAYSQFALKAHTGESSRRVKNDTYFNMVKQGSILRETKNFLPNFRWSIKKSNIQLKHG
jgi:hypothetical protein